MILTLTICGHWQFAKLRVQLLSEP